MGIAHLPAKLKIPVVGWSRRGLRPQGEPWPTQGWGALRNKYDTTVSTRVRVRGVAYAGSVFACGRTE